MQTKRILITGAGSEFGERTAIGLAQSGHDVIAAAEQWPQVYALRDKIKALGLELRIRVEKLDILDACDIESALKFDIDVLFSNVDIDESRPINEIPIDMLKASFESIVFAPLTLARGFIQKFIEEKRPGKIVFASSSRGLSASSSSYALETIAESLHDVLRPFNIKVQTINPRSEQAPLARRSKVRRLVNRLLESASTMAPATQPAKAVSH